MATPDSSVPDAVTIASGTSTVSVMPSGGKYTVTLNGVPVLTDVVRGDGKAIRTHVCTPNFGKDMSGRYGLSQHGNMRQETVSVTRTSDTSLTVTHPVTDNPGVFPAGITAVLDIALTDTGVTVTLTHTNAGTEAAPVNAGHHCYFRAPLGYGGTKINGRDITGLVETTGSVPLSDTNTIEIPGMPTVTMTQSGLPVAVTWVGQNPDGVRDTAYVCIEPVEGLPERFTRPESLIQPGQSRTVFYSLSV